MNATFKYIKTEFLRIVEKYDKDLEGEAKHYYYSHLDILPHKDDDASLRVLFKSRFEHTRDGVPFELETESDFELYNFNSSDSKEIVLADCASLAYKKHLQIVLEKLDSYPYENVITSILQTIEPRVDIINTILATYSNNSKYG